MDGIPEGLVIDEEKYISANGAASIVGVSGPLPLRNLYESGEIRGFQKRRGQQIMTYLLLEDVFTFKKKVDDIKTNCYTYKEAADVLGLSMTQLYRWKVDGKISFIKLFYDNYIAKAEVERLCSGKDYIIENYYTIEQVAELFSLSAGGVKDRLNRLKEEGIVFETTLTGSGSGQRIYYSKRQIDTYLKNLWKKKQVDPEEDINYVPEGYIFLSNATKAYNFTFGTLRDWSKKFSSTRLHKKSSRIMLSIKELEEYIAERAKQKERQEEYSYITDAEVAYKYFLESTQNEVKICQYIETIRLFKEFVRYELKSTKNSNFRRFLYSYVSALKVLPEVLNKEFHEYSDAEIKLFYKNPQISKANKQYLAKFLRYLYEQEIKCNFTKSKIPKRTYKGDPSKAQEIYSETVFYKFGVYVSDIDKNISKAIERPKHCQLWVYVLFHMFEAWRANDIFNIPNIYLEQIGVFDLDYFTHNRLTSTQAQMVVNQYYMQEFVINKTGALNCLNVPEILIEALGTALVIAEIHRRNNNKEMLMYCFRTYTPTKKDLESYFDSDKELASFSNLKACRTLMTLFYHWVEQQPDCHREAHEMLRRLRMHKLKKLKTLAFSETDTIYLQNIDETKEETFSKAMFDRGIFGWLYYMILKTYMSEQDFRELDFNDVTNLIVAMHDKQSPLQMEGLGKFLLKQQEKRKLLIEEIRSMPPQELWEKLKAIHSGLMPARIAESQCFKYGNCPHPRPQEHVCRQCPYLIPNKYFLVSLSNGLHKNLEKLYTLYQEEQDKRVNLETDITKTRSILIDYIYLLGEAQNKEYGLGEEVVRAFINPDDIRMKIKMANELHKRRMSVRGLL